MLGVFLRALSLCVALGLTAVAAEGSDIVDQIMPREPGQPVRLGRLTRRDAITRLLQARQAASGKRSYQVAFLLAALDADYVHNRDILIACLTPHTGLRDCDEDEIGFLTDLYALAHRDVLPFIVRLRSIE